MILQKKAGTFLTSFMALWALQACVKKNIQFGTDLGETYTRIIQVDTVSINMSTYLIDSFATSNIDQFLVGRLRDTSFGLITAKSFLQLSLPADKTIETSAVYDSLSFVIKLNKYYYGDTSRPVTITINELDAPVEYTYNNALYNTSSIAEKFSLGSKQVKISPALTDSIAIKLNDARGQELFNKLKNSEDEVEDATSFLNYFKGVSIAFSSSDESGVYGFKTVADSVFMRLHYHTSTLYPEKKYKDFAFNRSVFFNQLIADRSSTLISSVSNGLIPSTTTANRGYVQSGAGVLLKMTFPTLRSMLQIDPTVKLLKATLALKVSKGTYGEKNKLPSYLFLSQTDATNTMGNYLADSTGSATLFSAPITDKIYSSGTYYYFNVTSYINSLLTTSGSEHKGFFLLDYEPGTSMTIDRVLINSSRAGDDGSKLMLSFLTLKN